MDEYYSIDVACLFCNANFEVEKSKEYKSGSMIKCSECGELNDYDSILDIAKEKGVKLVKDEFAKEFKSKFKHLFK